MLIYLLLNLDSLIDFFQDSNNVDATENMEAHNDSIDNRIHHSNSDFDTSIRNHTRNRRTAESKEYYHKYYLLITIFVNYKNQCLIDFN